ncbi:hypothetical protein ACFLQN_00840 [Candidatus Aenigmatarchaeota archaeon]
MNKWMRNMFISRMPSEYRQAKLISDGCLSQQKLNPDEVYTFLETLAGSEELRTIGIGNIRVENTTPFQVLTTIRAEYTGDRHWGGSQPDRARRSMPCDEFMETADYIFGKIEEHTGYSITRRRANVKPENCRAHVPMAGKKYLKMELTKPKDPDDGVGEG